MKYFLGIIALLWSLTASPVIFIQDSGGGALTLVQEKSCDTGGATAASLTCTFDSNTVAGNLVVIVFGSDDSANGDVMGVNGTGVFSSAPTLLRESGSSAEDAHLGIFYREADNAATGVTMTNGSSDELWGHVMEYSGHNSTTPVSLGYTGTPWSSGSSEVGSGSVWFDTSPSPFNAGDRAYGALAFDGGDGAPFGTMTGFTATPGDLTSGTGANDASGTLQYIDSEPSSTNSVSFSSTDGAVSDSFIIHAE